MNKSTFQFAPDERDEHSQGAGTIRSVTRALKLLTLMNTRYALGLQDLHRLSGLPKPTVFRILATLEAEGYIEVDGRHGVYRVRPKVHELSAGYSEAAMLADLCRPLLLSTTQKIKWPLALGVLNALEMEVRLCTMPQSPLAVTTSTQGRRYNLLRSAMGVAYLAFCPDEEREVLLELASEEAGSEADQGQIRRDIDGARRRGYGLRLARKSGDSATAALPIRSGDRVIAVLGMTTFGAIMTKEFVPNMREVLDRLIAEIESAFAFHIAAPPASVAILKPRALAPLLPTEAGVGSVDYLPGAVWRQRR